MKKIFYPIAIFLFFLGIIERKNGKAVIDYNPPTQVLSESVPLPSPVAKPKVKLPKKAAPTFDMRKFFRRSYAPPALVTYDTTITGSGTSLVWNARITRTADYWQRTDSVAAFIYIDGTGGAGSDASKNNDHGPHSYIQGGWDTEVELPSGFVYPMVITLQPLALWPAPSLVNPKVDALLGRFRIKRRAVHVQGFSMGGHTWLRYITQDAVGGPYTYASKITTLFDSRGAKPSSTEMNPYPGRLNNFAIGGALGRGGNIIGIEQFNDQSRDVDTRVIQMNSNHPGSYYIRTTYGSGGHNDLPDAPFDPDETFPASNPEISTSTGSLVPAGGIDLSVYQWALLAGDTTGLTNSDGGSPPTNSPPVANAGSDISITLPTTNTSVSGSASTDGDGTIVSYAWSFVSGPATPVITTPTTVGSTITGLTVAGTYTLQLLVTDDDGATNTDNVSIVVNPATGGGGTRDYMLKNVTASRPGGGLKFHLGNTVQTGVTTTTISVQYIQRDNYFGQQLMGGDTIVLHANPNNGGIWNNVELGDFGGNATDKIVVMTDSVFKYGSTGGFFRIGIRDSNMVCFVKFDGLANRVSKGVVYGFQYDRAAAANDENAIGVVSNLFHHIEICGWSVINAGVGFFMKKNSSTTNPFAMHANITFRNVKLHDIYLHRINGEGFYIGHTDIAGTTQAGNDGPTIAGDSLEIYRVVIDSTEWDGIQVSNFGYNCSIHDIVTYRTGTANQSSQQWSIFIGGNTQGKIYNCVAVNGTGPLGILGKGSCEIYNCFIDSVDNGGTNADAIYVSQSNTGVPLPIDPLIVNTHNNVTRNANRNDVFHANTTGTMQPGFIANNIHVGSGGAYTSNASDAIGFNVSSPSYDVQANLDGSDAGQTYQLVRSNPFGTKVSFFDIENEDPDPVSPPIVFAGADQIGIVYPITSATLTATVTPAAGYTATYLWEKVNADAATITSPTTVSTDVEDLIPNTTYTFRITATQSDGQVISDEINVRVIQGYIRQYRQSIRIKFRRDQ